MSRHPIKVLQVVGVMDRAGLETWLMHVLRTIDRDRFQLDFLVETDRPGTYDDEIRSLGSDIFFVGARKPLTYGRPFQKLISAKGPYDVVHSHLNHLNGDIMRYARDSGVSVRIAHCHTDTTAKEKAAGLMRRSFVRIMQYWIAKNATHGLAASVPAAISMFGTDWKSKGLCRVLHCGLELGPFEHHYDQKEVRKELDLPSDGWVVGHVGRFDDVKNHQLLIESFAEIYNQVPDAWLLLVGEGPLREHTEELAKRLKVNDRVRFAGNRHDVPRVLCAAMDAFVFPSKFEGLGMALVEAQAAGLRCLVSDVVPKEADVVPQLITRLPISKSWANAMLSLRGHHRDTSVGLNEVGQSDFVIRRGVASLEQIYASSRLLS